MAIKVTKLNKSLGLALSATFLIFAAMPNGLSAQTVTVLNNFYGTDGFFPEAALVQGINGGFYGTAYGGGTGGCGTVFGVTPTGKLTTLHDFCTLAGDGTSPAASLVQVANGNLYGTTKVGGNRNGSFCSSQGGCGTIFEITPGGTLTTIYSFCAQAACADGANPEAGLVVGVDGNLYGTTSAGGTHPCPFLTPVNCGTVFKITPTGALTTLYDFCSQSGCSDGGNPVAPLLLGSDGTFYGTTEGNSGTGLSTRGTVFKIAPSGDLETLHNFCQTDCSDGENPVGGLIQASDGTLYGTTKYAGGNGQAGGTVFLITLDGALITLYSFCSQPSCADGLNPSAPLVQATDGNLYGTTELGGPGGNGTIFMVTLAGAVTSLYSFSGTNGGAPDAGLIQATSGELYGSTQRGGNYSAGTIFSVSLGLGAFVETRPAAGKVGRVVEILGNNLSATDGVSFSGTPAVFTIKSNSLITATVPVGAKTGTVQVRTPTAIFSSNVQFYILP